MIPKVNQKCDILKSKTPNYSSDIGTTYVKSGVYLNFVITRKESRVDIYIGTGSKEENEKIYDAVYSKKEKIEAGYPHKIRWQRLENKNACRIADIVDMSFYDNDIWEELSDILSDRYIEFYEFMRPYFK